VSKSSYEQFITMQTLMGAVLCVITKSVSYGWEFLISFLQTYHTFISTLDCKLLFSYLQFWCSYAIL